MGPMGGAAMKCSFVTCAGALMLLVAGTALAHHSPILFDRSRKLTLVGTIAEFAWINPHASIQLDVPKPGGPPERWGVEMNSRNTLVKDGWKSTLVKTGDKVTIVVYHLRSRALRVMLVSVKLAGGAWW